MAGGLLDQIVVMCHAHALYVEFARNLSYIVRLERVGKYAVMLCIE
jgi:hypothetical protein